MGDTFLLVFVGEVRRLTCEYPVVEGVQVLLSLLVLGNKWL